MRKSPVHGIISDGQHSIRNAVATAFPGVPHQLCHFHYLREAAKPVYEADRHAKKELKKQVRGIRPIEREAERLSLIAASLERGAQKGGCHLPSTNCFGCSQKELRRQSRCGLMSRQAMLSCIEQRIYWQTRTIIHRKRYNDSMRSCLRRCDTTSLRRPHFNR
jgi:MULE transposase domain